MTQSKIFIGVGVLLLGCWMHLTGCSSSNGADSLTDQLADQSFQLEIADVEDSRSLDCVTGLVPDASLSPAIESDNGTQIISALTVFVGDVTISFSGNEFTIEENGEVISAGTWAVLDEQTIDLTENGISSPFGITIDGDIVTLEVTEETIDILCAPNADISDPTPDDPTDDPNNDDTPVPNPISLTNRLAGTWCLESGYVFYLSLEIPTDGSVNTGFASFDASVVIEPNSDSQVRVLGINEYLQSAWIATDRLSDAFYRYAPLALDAVDPTLLLVEFGDGKEAVFKKSLSNEMGVCSTAAPESSPEDPTNTP